MFLAYPPAAWLRSIELIIDVKSWFSWSVSASGVK